jgi:hypothetical protein
MVVGPHRNEVDLTAEVELLQVEVRRLREIIERKDRLLVCYRTGDFRRADKILTDLEELEKPIDYPEVIS